MYALLNEAERNGLPRNRGSILHKLVIKTNNRKASH